LIIVTHRILKTTWQQAAEYGNAEELSGFSGDLGDGECAFDDIGEVARQIGRGFDALQRDFGLAAPALLKGAPGAEGGSKPCRKLRILCVEHEQSVGNEVIARPVGTVELGRVGGKSADQRADSVWVAEREGGVCGERPDLVERVGLRGHRL